MVRTALAATVFKPALVESAPIPIVLVYVPAVADVTFAITVQLPEAGIALRSNPYEDSSDEQCRSDGSC
jgi:hypothetical protein